MCAALSFASLALFCPESARIVYKTLIFRPRRGAALIASLEGFTERHAIFSRRTCGRAPSLSFTRASKCGESAQLVSDPRQPLAVET